MKNVLYKKKTIFNFNFKKRRDKEERKKEDTNI